MKKIIATLTVGTLLLSSCGKTPEAAVAPPEKAAFPVETRTISDFPSTYIVSKTGRMVGSSNIALNSQGMGQVEAILVKEGTIVKKWQVLVRLKDTVANYHLKLSQANNSLANAKNNTESSHITLDKAVNDTWLALEKAKSDQLSTEITANKNLEKAVRDSSKSQLTGSSDASVTLDQLQASLDKAKLDRENLIISNRQTITNYGPSYENIVNDIKKFYTKILFEEDRRYGFTSKFQGETTTMRPYLGARLANTRDDVENAYLDLVKAGSELDPLPTKVDEANIIAELDRLGRTYKAARVYLESAGRYLENSITSSILAQSTLDGYIAITNGYKTELSALENSQTAFKNGVSTFLANYRNNESSAASALTVQEKNIEVQRRQLQTTSFDTTNSLDKLKASNDQLIATSRIAVQSAQLAYDNAVRNREVTLKKLALAESDASLSIAQAAEEVGKLSIVAPIDGSVTRVIASVGQDVSVGTALVELANKNPEITFDIDASIVPLLKIGSSQKVKYQNMYYTGTVTWVSQVATDSLLYTARLVLPDSQALLGQVASIELELPGTHPIVPSEIVKVISDKKGEIETLSGEVIAPVEVELGRIIGNKIEIISEIDPKTQIITSNVLNFDPKKSKIVVENKKK